MKNKFLFLMLFVSQLAHAVGGQAESYIHINQHHGAIHPHGIHIFPRRESDRERAQRLEREEAALNQASQNLQAERRRQYEQRRADEQREREAIQRDPTIPPLGFNRETLARWREAQRTFTSPEFSPMQDIDLENGVRFNEPVGDLSIIDKRQLNPTYAFKSHPVNQAYHLREMKYMYAKFEMIHPADARRQYARHLGMSILREADFLSATDFLFESGVYKDIAQDLLNIAIGFHPVASKGRALYEVFSGRDLITNRPLSIDERAFNLALAMTNTKGIQTVISTLFTRAAPTILRGHIPYQVLLDRGSRIAANAFNPIRPGRLDHVSVKYDQSVQQGAPSVAGTFRSNTYVEEATQAGERYFRTQSQCLKPDSFVGRYWTRVEPKGPTQIKIDAALHPHCNNTAEVVVEMSPPPGVLRYRGIAGEQGGEMNSQWGFREGTMQPGQEQIFFEDVPIEWITNMGRPYQ